MDKVKERLNAFYKKSGEVSNKISSWIHDFIYKYDIAILMAIVTILSVVIRISVLDCVRGDFTNFLNPWYNDFYVNGYKQLGVTIGDYTPAYYYFLWFISLFKLKPYPESLDVLHAIKWFSIMFDYGIATFIFLGVKHITKSDMKAAIGYVATVLGITIFLNSALWAQCDAIYSFFVIGSLFFVMKGKQRTSMIFYGLAFCFKIQSIFVLPVFIILWLRNKFKFRFFAWILIVYVLMAVPSCIISGDFFGRMIEILGVFVNQSVNSYQQLSLNCGSFYALIFTNFVEEKFISAFSVPLAVGVIGTYMFMIFRSKEKFGLNTWVKIATLFALLFPYMLPHMHERYFYIADVIVIVYALINPKKFYIAIMALMNSMIGYMVYLWNVSFISSYLTKDSNTQTASSFRFGSILYFIAIVIISIDLFKEIYPNGLEIKKDEPEDSSLNSEEVKLESLEDDQIHAE